MDFLALAQQCAPDVHPHTMAAIMRVESSYNPYAIGVVGGKLERQPQNKDEAVATAKALEKAGFNFSMGTGQVNRYNLAKYGLDYETVFEPCGNFRASSLILKDCYERAKSKYATPQEALQASFSCYYSGNFRTGFTQDFKGQPSYVQKVLNSAGALQNRSPSLAIPVIRTTKQTVKPKQIKKDEAVKLKAESLENETDDATNAYENNNTNKVMVYE